MGNKKDNKFENEEFFNKIYSEYIKIVYTKIKNMLDSKINDDINSCVQDTFVKAWNDIEKLKIHENVGGWLITTAFNTASNFNRNNKTRRKYTDDAIDMENIIQSDDFVQDLVEEAEFEEFLKSDIVGKFLNELSESEHQLYELKHLKKLSNEEIGKILGISARAVIMRNSRLIDKFKRDFLGLKK